MDVAIGPGDSFMRFRYKCAKKKSKIGLPKPNLKTKKHFRSEKHRPGNPGVADGSVTRSILPAAGL